MSENVDTTARPTTLPGGSGWTESRRVYRPERGALGVVDGD